MIVYIAHPLGAGPDREANRKSASEWAAWIAKTFKVATVADWIILSGEWDESPENRELGLRIDVELIGACDALVMVGPRRSEGMLIERHNAIRLRKHVVDWVGLSRETIGANPEEYGQQLFGDDDEDQDIEW